MPNYNGVEKFTVTNGGGTINLDVLHASTTRYVFSGTATLAAGYTIQATGTPVEGMEFDIRWQSVCTTAGANVVTVFGTVLTTAQALADLIITVYYNGSAWDVDIQEDSIDNIWEVGSGTNSAKLVNGGTSTASNTGSVNAGTNNTVSGQYAFSAGISNTASATQSTTLGASNTASGTNSVALGVSNTATAGTCVAIGGNCDATGSGAQAFGENTTASGSHSHSEGEDTSAANSYTHAGGWTTVASRFGQFSRSSGRITSTATDYMQFSKITTWNLTTDATPTLLYLDGDTGALEVLTIPTNCIAYFRGEAVAIQTAGAAGTVGDSASFHFNGCIKNVAGTTALVDTVRWQDNTGAWGASAQRTQDAAAATWTLVPTANNGNDTLSITATGEANKEIQWLCNIELTEIRYTP